MFSSSTLEFNKNFQNIIMDEPEELTDFIDYNLVGSKKKLRLNSTSFIAGYLQLFIRSGDFQGASQAIQERIRHLSFLVHLFCRYDDFEAVFHEYKIVQVITNIRILNCSWRSLSVSNSVTLLSRGWLTVIELNNT